jgi:hypothetical protein
MDILIALGIGIAYILMTHISLEYFNDLKDGDDDWTDRW